MDNKVIKRALELAGKQYGNDVRAITYNESKKYILVVMSNPEIDEHDGGDERPWLLINKETGKELFDSGFIIYPIEGFEDFNIDDLECTNLE